MSKGENIKDSVLAFVSGDLTTMASMSFLGIVEDLLPVALAGFVGGFMGIAGKQFYRWLERKMNKKEEQ